MPRKWYSDKNNKIKQWHMFIFIDLNFSIWLHRSVFSFDLTKVDITATHKNMGQVTLIKRRANWILTIIVPLESFAFSPKFMMHVWSYFKHTTQYSLLIII